jgi:acyl-CoA reductase-like NAD-dependent aldehyde dehydrogenase
MLGPMSAKRVVIYMPDALLEALNRATSASAQSRSEIICSAVQRYVAEAGRSGLVEPANADEAFFDRVAEMMQSGLLQPGDFSDPASDEPKPKSKLWIN